jgi:hypothetical protein
MFTVVRLGCCTVAAHDPIPKADPSYPHIYLNLLHVVLPTIDLARPPTPLIVIGT